MTAIAQKLNRQSYQSYQFQIYISRKTFWNDDCNFMNFISQKREIGLATMLLCVVAVFFIFNILAMVVNIFEAANILVDEMTRVSNLLVSVNSSVNFVIYCIFGDKFQRLFLRYFCYCYCCCRRRRPVSGNIFQQP